MPGMLRVELALEAPEHVVGIELAAGVNQGVVWNFTPRRSWKS